MAERERTGAHVKRNAGNAPFVKSDKRSVQRDDKPAPRRRRRPLSTLVPAIVVVVVALLAVQGLRLLPGWLNPFAERTIDRSGPVVIKSIRDLSRYEAAVGTFQVVVDLEKEAAYLPSAIKGNRTLFVGNGSVNAYVDFSQLPLGAITVDKTRLTATVRLPHAQLEPTSLDPKHSYVFATQQGLLDRIGSFFSGNPNDQQQLYVLAAQKIQTAAQASGLLARADDNAKSMIENLLRALGFKAVTVVLPPT